MTELGLRDKVVIVTGAGAGLGRAFALGFASAGARVAIADINLKAAEETAELIEDQRGLALAISVDIANEPSTRDMASTVARAWGGIDVLVNNAGIYATLQRHPFYEIAVEEWDRVMAVNLRGPFLCAKAVHAELRKRGEGRIVNVASATVMSGSPLWMHYVASKGGVIAMTRVMARELGEANITVNALAPGFTLTEASLGMMENASSYGVERGAIKRAATPEDMVGAALYLGSRLSGFMTGQTLIVDGGRQFI
jgi:NAD(P)-dependent dehydrogenase (short-subunit alcohol dehydrogenase family)